MILKRSTTQRIEIYTKISDTRAEVKKRKLRELNAKIKNITLVDVYTIEDIASITDESGRILGMIPHPEHAIFFTQLSQWPLLKEKYTNLWSGLASISKCCRIL